MKRFSLCSSQTSLVTVGRAARASRAARCCLVLAALLALTPAFGAGPPPVADHAYRVTPGDTIISIAQRLLQTPGDYFRLQRHNRLSDAQTRVLRPGSVVNVPADWLRREPDEATVMSLSGAVHAMQDGRQEPLRTGQALRARAVVTTGADGRAAIRLADASVIRLPPQSELRLDAINRLVTGRSFDQLLTLLRGRAEADIQKVEVPGRLGLATPVAALGVRGTVFRASYDPAQSVARAEVLEGRVAFDGVAPGSGSRLPGVSLDAGTGAVTDKSGVPSAPRALLDAPVLALPGAQLQERVVVRFALQAQAGAAGFRAQISPSGSGDIVLREQIFVTPEVKFADLTDGSYTLALRAIDDLGLEGKSLTEAFRLKARPEPPIAQAPAPNGKARGEIAQFVWGESTVGNHYRFQLARDGAFRDLVQEETSIKSAALTSRVLQPGTYFWRVGSIKPDGDIGPWGDAMRFHMLPATSSPQASEANGQVQFAWSGEPGQRFLVQISRDRGFGSFIHNAEITETRLAVTQPAAGVYFIRLRATDADGFVGPFTPPQRFEVINRLATGDAASVTTGGGTPVRIQ